jgi:two-component system, sensor histidine kinase
MPRDAAPIEARNHAMPSVAPARWLGLLWPCREGSSCLAAVLMLGGALLVIAVLVGALELIIQRRDTAYAAAEREATSISVALAEQTARTLEAAHLNLADVANKIHEQGIESQDALKTLMGTHNAYNMLRVGISGLSQVSSIAIVGADGRLINASYAWPPPPLNLADREYFRDVDQGLERFITPPILSQARRIWTVYVVQRLSAPDGSFLGVVAGAIELPYLEEFYRLVAADADLEVSLWRYDGTLLASYPKREDIGKVGQREPVFGPSYDAARRAAQAYASSHSVAEARPVAALAVKGFPLFVSVARTKASIRAEWRGQASAIGVGAIIIAILLGAASIALARQIARREVIEGMLRQHRDNLGREVRERTKALAISEARHRDVAEIAGDWLWEIDTERRFTFVSRRFGEAAGLTPEMCLGKRIEELPSFTIAVADSGRVFAAMHMRNPYSGLVSRVTLADGRTRFWRTSGKPFFDPETGTFAGYRGCGSDATSEVESEIALNQALTRAETAEEEARRARSKLFGAIEAMPAGFALWDAEDRLELCNARYREIYSRSMGVLRPGVTFEEVLRAGATFGEYTLPPGHDLDAWIKTRVALHRAPRSFFEHRLADGRWIQIDERQISGGGVVGTRIDTTELHRREAKEHEREKLAALGHLAGGVAHEINNLLQPAIIFPELVMERLPESDQESREDLATVLESARKARDIVKNILRFARKEELVLEAIDLPTELHAALAFMRDVLPPGITIEEKLPEALPRRGIMANKTQLTQVVTNLLVNAAHAMQDHGTVTVTLAEQHPTADDAMKFEIDPGRAYLALSIADTGCGMDEATQARIFEPFFTTKPVGQGTGLGLSVAYGILQSWKGAIAVSSAPGKGTTFTLYIPIAEKLKDVAARAVSVAAAI